MNKRILSIAFSFVVLLSITASSVYAQRRNVAPPKPGANLLSALPQSDVVSLIMVKRVLDEAVPKLLAGNPAKLAQVNAELENFKTRTGVDPRSFDQIALGMRFNYPSEGITKVTTVAIANGTFSAGAFAAAGRIAANGKYREETYQGKTIYVFQLDQQSRLLGLFDVHISDLAVSPLDAHTLALGNLESVRSVIAAGKTRGRANAELIALATRDADGIMGFGANISRQLLDNLSLSNDAIARDLTSVRQVYGSIGLTERDLELSIAARTVDSFAARNLSDSVEALRQFGGLFVGRLPGAKGVLAKSALTNLKITTQGNELQIVTAVAHSEIAPLMGGL